MKNSLDFQISNRVYVWFGYRYIYWNVLNITNIIQPLLHNRGFIDNVLHLIFHIWTFCSIKYKCWHMFLQNCWTIFNCGQTNIIAVFQYWTVLWTVFTSLIISQLSYWWCCFIRGGMVGACWSCWCWESSLGVIAVFSGSSEWDQIDSAYCLRRLGIK